MNDFNITLPVENPDEPPCVDVHYEALGQYALWLSGRYGYETLDGHEIGLSPDLVRDLCDWTEVEDALFNHDDPPNSGSTDGFAEKGFELARRVRSELPEEWVVTTRHPAKGGRIVLPLSE